VILLTELSTEIVNKMLLRCHACRGSKKVYQINGGYTLSPMLGGSKMKCPECGGLGKVLSKEEKEELKSKHEEEKQESAKVVDKKSSPKTKNVA